MKYKYYENVNNSNNSQQNEIITTLIFLIQFWLVGFGSILLDILLSIVKTM
jgi:hypothetical protein